MKEAMMLALEALEPLVKRASPYGEVDWLTGCKAITALREALAEQPAPVQQEPERSCFDIEFSYQKIYADQKAELAKALAEQPAPVQGWKLALDAAVSALYFDDSSDFRAGLGAVIRHLDPQLAGEMLAHPKAAYDKVKALLAEQPAQQQEPVAWVPYLSDRADGVKGHYAIARWNPRGYREVWNLRRHEWGAYSDDVLSLEEADTLLRLITIPTRKVTSPQPAPVQEPVGYEKYAAIREGHRNACEEAYFGARPDIPLSTSTLTVFRHGFDRGYDLAAATPQPAVQQEPVAFYVYKPTLPRGHLGTVSDGDLPWVYDQDPSSGFSARMLVAPVASPPAQRKPLTPQEFEALQYKVKGYVQTGLMDVVRMVEEHHNIKEKP